MKVGSSNLTDSYSGGWLFAKGAGTNAPYWSVVKRTGVAYDAFTEYTRLGNLNGYLGETTDKYGFGIGDSTQYLKYDSAGGLRLYSNVANAITIDYGGDILLKEGGDIKFTSVAALSLHSNSN